MATIGRQLDVSEVLSTRLPDLLGFRCLSKMIAAKAGVAVGAVVIDMSLTGCVAAGSIGAVSSLHATLEYHADFRTQLRLQAHACKDACV